MEKSSKNKIISTVFTLFILGLLVLSGPVKALKLNLSEPSEENIAKGNNAEFTFSLKVWKGERLNGDISLYLNNNLSCEFDINGKNSSECKGIIIEKSSEEDRYINYDYCNSNYGYGYGYGYGYDYGYGYGYSETCGSSQTYSNTIHAYNIIINTSYFDLGVYDIYLKAKNLGKTTLSGTENFEVLDSSYVGSGDGGNGSGDDESECPGDEDDEGECPGDDEGEDPGDDEGECSGDGDGNGEEIENQNQNITLINPANDYSAIGEQEINFSYEINDTIDLSKITGCNLNLINLISLNSEIFEINISELDYFNSYMKTIPIGSYSWKIGCILEDDGKIDSIVRNLIINPVPSNPPQNNPSGVSNYRSSSSSSSSKNKEIGSVEINNQIGTGNQNNIGNETTGIFNTDIPEEFKTNRNPRTFLSGVTGAVIGVGSTIKNNPAFAFGFVILLIVARFGISRRRKKL